MISGKPGCAQVATHLRDVGASDHRLVSLQLSEQIQSNSEQTPSFVYRANPDKWDDVLLLVEPALWYVARSVLSLQHEIQSAGNIPVKRQRSLLEAAAWVQEALYLLVGHLGSLVAAKPAKKRNRTQSQHDSCHSGEIRRELDRLRKFVKLHEVNPNKSQEVLIFICEEGQSIQRWRF